MEKCIDIWAPLFSLPDEATPPNYDKRCIKITIPAICKDCNQNIESIVISYGSEDTQGGFIEPCPHYQKWEQLWEMRIENKSSKFLDPTQDGCKCKKYGDFYYMAEANQSDGVSMICYVCRNHR